MKTGRVEFLPADAGAGRRVYMVVVSGTGEVETLPGYAVASAIALNADTPEFVPSHLVLEGLTEDDAALHLLRALRGLPGNAGSDENVDWRNPG